MNIKKVLIVGVSDLLSRTQLDSKQRHYVELVTKSSDWLMRVISEVLDFSKIEAGELVIESSQFDLHQTIEDLASLHRQGGSREEIDFRCRLAPEIPRFLIGDQLRLIQVLGNLLSNAFKFTEKGFVEFRIEMLSLEMKQTHLKFSVADSGIGISDVSDGVKMKKAMSSNLSRVADILIKLNIQKGTNDSFV